MYLKRRFIVSAISLRIFCLVIAVLLLSINLLGRYRPAAAQSNAVTLKFEPGFGGYYRADRWMPLLVNVSNSGPDVSGELHVTAGATASPSPRALATNVD